MPIRYVLSSGKIRHILLVIHYTIRGAVCFQFTHFPCDDWENIYTLSNQIGSMNYYPLFRVRSWNNGVRFMSFCIHMFTETNRNFELLGYINGYRTDLVLDSLDMNYLVINHLEYVLCDLKFRWDLKGYSILQKSSLALYAQMVK